MLLVKVISSSLCQVLLRFLVTGTLVGTCHVHSAGKCIIFNFVKVVSDVCRMQVGGDVVINLLGMVVISSPLNLIDGL